jgi:hypothetical protein
VDSGSASVYRILCVVNGMLDCGVQGYAPIWTCHVLILVLSESAVTKVDVLIGLASQKLLPA